MKSSAIDASQLSKKAMLTFVVSFLFAPLGLGQTITLSPKLGPPTIQTLVSGSGFSANAAIDIYFDTTDQALAIANSSGAFSNIAIQIPATAAPGNHYVSAVQRSNSTGAQTTFNVSASWTQFGNGTSHHGTNIYENVLNPSNVSSLDLLWSFATGNFVASPVAVVNGVVYTGSDDGSIYAINATTGAKLWSYYTGSNLIYGSPAVVSGVVYAVAANGSSSNILALNASTGTVIWNVPMGEFIEVAPTVANGVLYLGTTSDHVYALKTTNGAVIWSYTTGGYISGEVAVSNGVVYAGSSDGKLYALNTSSGSLIWSVPLAQYVGTPALGEGLVYVGTGSSHNLYAVNAANGSVVWTFTANNIINGSSPIISNGVVYVGSQDFNVYALNARTGSLLWQYTTGANVISAPAEANGVVYVGSVDDNFYALNAATGALLWSYSTGGWASSPVVVNGMVFAGSLDSKIYAFALGIPSKGPRRPGLRSLHPDLSLTASRSARILPGSED